VVRKKGPELTQRPLRAAENAEKRCGDVGARKTHPHKEAVKKPIALSTKE